MRKNILKRVLTLTVAGTMCLSTVSPALAAEPTEPPAEQTSVQPLAVDAGPWKLQEWGKAEDIELQEGWITPTENGFTLDYAKLISDRGKEGIVLYDSSAASWQASTLEMDVTLLQADTPDGADQARFYSFGVFPVFQSGADCEGVSIHDTGHLEHSRQTSGSERYNWVRGDEGDFVFGETYHLKYVVDNGTITFYAAKKGEELQQKASFEMDSGLGAGGYGFRIWRGAKTVKVENIVRTEIAKSYLEKTKETVPADQWCKNPVNIPVVLKEGDSVASISDGALDLTPGSHYSVVDNTITIMTDYLKGQTDKKQITLTVQFASGDTGVFTLLREEKTVGAGGWVLQKQSEDKPTEIQDGWIVASEDGTSVVIDYGKIVNDTGKEAWVVYDGAAPKYLNSSLEYDITFSEPTQPDFIAVAPASRVVDGRNYEGFAITSGTGLERTGRKDDSESYAGVNNLLGVKFEYDKTYHIRIETIGSTITVYLTRDGKEEKLTSFDSPIGLGESSYGFRIWRGGKKITLENIKRTEIITSSLDKSVVQIDKADWGKEDVTAQVKFGNGDSIASVKNGETELTAGTDYTLDGNTFTLTKEYIAAQKESFRLQITFAMGSTAALWVMKYDPDVEQEYVWTPDQGIDMWTKLEGSGSFEMAEDGSGMLVKGRNVLVNELAPLAINGEIEFTFEFLDDNWQRDQKNHGIGSLFRVDQANGSWQSVAVDGIVSSIPRWSFLDSNGANSEFTLDGDTLLSRAGLKDYKIKHRFVDDSFTLWMDDQFAHTDNIEKTQIVPGQMGLMFNGDLGNIVIKKVVFREVAPMKAEEGKRETIKLENDGLTVQLDKDFPRVAQYELNGKTMQGAEVRYNYATVNAMDLPATAELTEQGKDYAVYHVVPDQTKTGVTFDVKFTVLDDQILEMLILNIHEPEGELVYSIGLPRQPLFSARSTDENASLDASYLAKPVSQWGIKDLHEDIANVSKTSEFAVTIPIISNGQLSASAFNNVFVDGDGFVYRGFDLGNGVVSAGFWNNLFLYRGLDDEKVLPFPSEPDEENLYCRVAIAEDTNGDDIINWQDGANAVKKITNGVIPGGDQAARSFFHVGYNFASGVQQPFLKVADNMKRLSNYMDGFGQQLIFKGYANEGHDSGHADYQDINQRAGGAEDMNIAIAEADKINANLGIHLNNQEAYPEAKMFNDLLMSGINGWAWMDQSKYIRRDADMLSGSFDNRLNEMFAQIPDLDFVYVDCWQGDRWNELKFIGNMMRNGAELFANENAADFNRFGVWVHSTGSTVSNGIHQFVYNNQKDVYPGSSIYWGGYSRGASMMSWQHNNNINTMVEQFFTNQLPQKYLMCHEVNRVADGVGYFSGNVTSGNYVITKDGNKLTDGQGKIFIPWYDENSETKDPDEAAKIYHWNSNGGDTTWTLPASWQNLDKVYLYKTTQTGKQLVDTLDVTDGQVTIHADAKTPYVVYPAEAEADETDWSTGSPLKDTGFNSRDFSIWQKDGEANIFYEDDGNGVSILNMTGAAEGSVSQTMTGLVPGQKYRVMVHAGAENGKTARITVENGGKTYENYLEQVIMTNQYFDSYVKGKKMQRMWVDFVAEGTTATVTLSGDACESADGKVTFMESRIVETAEPDLPEGYVANETFEYVEQGAYGIFNPEGSSDGVPHLSETHLPYTTDTITGDWSLKMYGHYGQGQPTVRTSPATMRLEPNTEYTMEFDTQGSGGVYVESEADGNDKVLNARFENGHNKFTFTTGDKTDYIARIESGARVLDNFKVYRTAEVTEVTGIALDSELQMTVGDTATLNPEVQPANANNKQVHWNTDNNDVVSVDQTGKLTAVAEGTATITATTVEGGFKTTVTVTVTSKPTPKYTLTVNGGEGSGEYTEGQQVTVTATVPEGQRFVQWTAEGIELTADQQTSAEITFAMPAGAVKLTAEFEKLPVAVTGVELDKTELELTAGESGQLNATVLPGDAANKAVEWSSDNTDVVKVYQNGKVEAVAEGTAVITVTTEDGGFTASCTVTVKPVPKYTLTVKGGEGSGEYAEGQQVTVTATVPEGQRFVKWTAEGVELETPTAQTLTFPMPANEVTLTAVFEEIPPETVPVTGVKLDKTELTLDKGDTAKLTATITPAEATEKGVLWNSTNNQVATVDENGVVKAISAGTVTITVITKDGGFTASCTVTVKDDQAPVQTPTPTPDTTTPPTTGDGGSNLPATGDASTPLAVSALLAMTAAAAIVLKRRKNF